MTGDLPTSRLMTSWRDGPDQLKAEEIVLRATLAQRPPRPPLPSSPPPPQSIPPFTRPIRASTSSSLDDSPSASTTSSSETDDDTTTPLRFERKNSSPSREVPQNGKSYTHQVPFHVMKQVFSHLEIQERAAAAAVCRRWYHVLTGGRCPLENVVVLNVFQKSIWEANVSKNKGSTVQCLQLPNVEALHGLLLHVSEPSSVKIWYDTPDFAKTVLQKLDEVEIKTRCVDIFPYSDEIGLEHFYQHLPTLTGITMRPHGTKHFWEGLNLNEFPPFPKLDTLILDSFNFQPDLVLPESITTFEWHNRREHTFPTMLPKLATLKNLEYLHIGHSDFTNLWERFLHIICGENMPKLNYLMFRFCRFGKDSLKVTNCLDPLPDQKCNLKKLQFLKLDLCYGYIPQTVGSFLDMTSDALKIVSLAIISDESPVLFDQIYDEVATKLKRRNVSLHLGLLQKGKDNIKEIYTYKVPSSHFQRILWKFEASFCDDPPLLDSIFLTCRYPYMTELKFIQCPALTNEIMEAIATSCPRLKRLSLLGSDAIDNRGILAFVANFGCRTSKNLDIIWKRDSRRFSRPAAFYLQLTSEHRDLLDGLQTRFYCKSFSESNSGEAIVITEKSTGKSLVIQDYDHHDKQRILGVVLPHPPDHEPPNRSPPPIPMPLRSMTSRFAPLVENVMNIPVSTSEPSSPSPSSTSSSGGSSPPN